MASISLVAYTSVAPTVAEGIRVLGRSEGSVCGGWRGWVGQGSRYRQGRGWELSAFLLKLFEGGLENSAVRNCVGIIEVVV